MTQPFIINMVPIHSMQAKLMILIATVEYYVLFRNRSITNAKINDMCLKIKTNLIFSCALMVDGIKISYILIFNNMSGN